MISFYLYNNLEKYNILFSAVKLLYKNTLSNPIPLSFLLALIHILFEAKDLLHQTTSSSLSSANFDHPGHQLSHFSLFLLIIYDAH